MPFFSSNFVKFENPLCQLSTRSTRSLFLLIVSSVHSCLGLRSTKFLANVSSSLLLLLLSPSLPSLYALHTNFQSHFTKMLFPVLAPSISSSSSRSSDSNPPPQPRRIASTESTESSTSSRSLSSWFSGLKRRNSNDLEEKLVKSCSKLDRQQREKREKELKKQAKEQKLRARKEQVRRHSLLSSLMPRNEVRRCIAR